MSRLTAPERLPSTSAVIRSGRCTRWSRLFVGLAAAHVAGLQWCLLQIVAWTGMIASYVPDSGWRDGLGDTFSGSRPCALCCAVSEGLQEEDREMPAPVRQAHREVYPPGEIGRGPLPVPPPGHHVARMKETENAPEVVTTGPATPPPRRVWALV